MKKIITVFFFFLVSAVNAGGHLSDKDKKAILSCTGLYYANSMIPQGTLELEKIVYSIAAKKFLTSYLMLFKANSKPPTSVLCPITLSFSL